MLLAPTILALAAAAHGAPPVQPCGSAEARQFDFWISGEGHSHSRMHDIDHRVADDYRRAP